MRSTVVRVLLTVVAALSFASQTAGATPRAGASNRIALSQVDSVIPLVFVTPSLGEGAVSLQKRLQQVIEGRLVDSGIHTRSDRPQYLSLSVHLFQGVCQRPSECAYIDITIKYSEQVVQARTGRALPEPVTVWSHSHYACPGSPGARDDVLRLATDLVDLFIERVKGPWEP
jgi:hypothetical protein